MSAKERFDLAVVGAGPGGYVAAIRAAQLGLRAAVIEEDRLGGVCLNWGCIPSKALLSGAELVESLRSHADAFGVSVDGITLDYGRLVDHSRKTADRMHRGVASLLNKRQIRVVAGRGRLAGPAAVEVSGPEGSSLVEAERIVLATGSAEWVPPGVEVDGQRVLTSREALASRRIPERLLVVGAGAVGVELAYVYAMYGARVTVVEMADQVLPGADSDVALALARELRRKQIEVRTATRFEQLKLEGAGVHVSVSHGGAEDRIEADQVLLALGRRPLSGDLGLERAGVELDARGFVHVDGELRTNVPSVYAIGDLARPPLLAHKASEEGIAAAEHAAGTQPTPVDLRRIPGCIYCQPQVAWIGLTEAEARATYGDDLRVGRFPMTASGKAVAARHTAGFVKILAEPRYGQLVGAHVVGHGATELIAELSLALALEATPDDIGATCHAHPTLSEAILEAALAAEGRAIHI